MSILVTGGAGYIGSFVVRALLGRGLQPVVVDNLLAGHIESVPPGVPFENLSCQDGVELTAVMKRYEVEAVIHLAGVSLVGESVEKPGIYWSQNVGGAASLLEACSHVGVRRFVFSSSAAVYGELLATPAAEDHPLAPLNPYGATKRAVEEMLSHFQRARGLSWASLRYFNAAGASPEGDLGEDHDPETHLIPRAFAAASGAGPALTVFGEDYPTPDGTCQRDYVHVIDLAEAHVRVLDWFDAHPPAASLIANLGGGGATSVREVIGAVAAVTGRTVPVEKGSRRPGDPAVLVAGIERAATELGWRPRRSELATIVGDAWAWHRRHPAGYLR